MPSLPMAVEFVMNSKIQHDSVHQNRSWKAMTVTWPRTPYLSQRAAEAGSQCKCFCCLHHPLVAGSGHPRHIWHSLHSGLSHLSQSLCRLSPAWKDSKHQDFFWVWLEPQLESTIVQPNLQQLLQISFCGQFPPSGPCALLCQQAATAHGAKPGSHSELNKPFRQQVGLKSHPVPTASLRGPSRHKAETEKDGSQWPELCRIASFSISTDIHQLEIFKSRSTSWQLISYMLS